MFKPLSMRLQETANPASASQSPQEKRSGLPYCPCFYCSPALYHNKCQHLSADNAQHGSQLYFNKHDFLELAITAANWTQPLYGQLTPAQVEAVYEWHRRWPSEFSALDKTQPGKQKLKVLKTVFHFFNRIFFRDAIKTVDITFTEETDHYDAATSIGPGPQQVKIVFYPWKRRTGRPLREELINMLLHEMVHAFFALYGCYAGMYTETCSDAEYCRWLGDQNMGAGHGRAFVWLATALQEAAWFLLGFRADLNIIRRAADNVDESGVHMSMHDIRSCLPGAQCRRGW